jgi:lysophospholipase L1-like esterase
MVTSMRRSVESALVWFSLSLTAACGSPQDGPRGAASVNEGGKSGMTGSAGAAGATTSGGAASSAGHGGSSVVGGASSGGGGAGSAQGGAALMPMIPTGGVVAPDAPQVRYFGRWVKSDPSRPVASWGPVALKLRFEGASLAVKLEDEGVDLGAEGRGNVYQFSIDGGPIGLIQGTDATSFELASNLAEGEHEVLLVRRTESKWGKTTFLGFQLAEGARVLDPGPASARRIEVFGDSISAGLANENSGYYTNQTENGYLAFGPALARKLDAEWRVEARGGGSFYNDFYLPMVPYFARSFGPRNQEHAPAADNPLWSFDEWQPHVLIVALGTNDFSEQYPHIDEGSYVPKYQAFLQTLRGHYPAAEVFCMAPFKPGAPWDEARSYIGKAVAELGDAHVHAIDPTADGGWLTFPDDYVAQDAFHPNLSGHEKIASSLEPIVRKALGW